MIHLCHNRLTHLPHNNVSFYTESAVKCYFSHSILWLLKDERHCFAKFYSIKNIRKQLWQPLEHARIVKFHNFMLSWHFPGFFFFCLSFVLCKDVVKKYVQRTKEHQLFFSFSEVHCFKNSFTAYENVSSK